MVYIYTCKLTTKHSRCLLNTPLSSSGSRHCSHSNIVFSASIQSRQNSRRCRKWDKEDSCTAPRRCPTSSVLHLVLRDGHITLGSGPGHPQNWCPRFHCCGHRNTTDSWRSFQRDIRMKLSFIATHANVVCTCAMQRQRCSYSRAGWQNWMPNYYWNNRICTMHHITVDDA